MVIRVLKVLNIPISTKLFQEKHRGLNLKTSNFGARQSLSAKSFLLGRFGYCFFLCVPLCALVAKIRRWI